MASSTAIQADEKGAAAQAQQAGAVETAERDAEKQAATCEGSPALRQADDESAAKDEKQLFLKRILAAHERWYDVQRGYEYAGRTFPGYAEFHSYGEKYVLVKRAKLWGANTHEYVFFVLTDRLDEATLDDWVAFMETEGLAKVDPEQDHMSSAITLAIVADCCDDEVEKRVRKTRFRKNFAFGMRGWADLRLVVTDISAKRVYANAAGKQLRDTLQRNLELPNRPKTDQ